MATSTEAAQTIERLREVVRHVKLQRGHVTTIGDISIQLVTKRGRQVLKVTVPEGTQILTAATPIGYDSP